MLDQPITRLFFATLLLTSRYNFDTASFADLIGTIGRIVLFHSWFLGLKMNLLFLLAAVATSSSTLIPVTIDLSGIPRVDAEFGPAPMHPHVVHLGGAGSTVAATEAVGNPLRLFNMGLRITTINSDPVMEIPGAFFHRLIQVYGASSTIGIGPGSDLLGVGRSIDFVRQSTVGGFLRLGGSGDNFISNDCLPNSIMRMITNRRPLPVGGQMGGVTPRVETRISISIGDNIVATDSVSLLESERFLLTMPHGWAADIFALLPPSRERYGYRTVFTDCAQTRQRLPVITLTFTAGGLRLLPEDYTRQIGQDDTCELLIGRMPVWAANQSVRFNPLLIPGINARSTESEIILCDSAINL